MSRKRLAWGFAVILAVAVALAFLAQRQIGNFLFERAVGQRVGVDRSAELADGLHVYVCGSGGPMLDAQRAGPCIAVLAGDRGYVFDTGSGSIRKLGAMGFPLDRLKAVFLTHLHSDHIDGLGELLLQAWIAGQRDAPLPVFGPPRTEEVVLGLMQAYDADKGYRIAHHGEKVANPNGFGAIARPAEAGTVLRDGDITVTAIEVDHAPVDHALAYRIEYGGRSVTISGDTKYSEDLVAFAKDTDVLVHEALNPEMIGKIGIALGRRGNTAGAKIMADIPEYHTSPDEAARVAQASGAKALILYHLVPPPRARLMESAFLGAAPDLFDGTLELAEDGMMVSLPANSQQVQFHQEI